MENDKILVGKIVGAQGLHGEVRVQTYTAHPDDFKELNIIVGANNYSTHKNLRFLRGPDLPLQNPKLKFIRALPHSAIIIAKINGVDDRNAAEALRDTPLFTERAALPALATGEYYQADLVGMRLSSRRAALAASAGSGGFGRDTNNSHSSDKIPHSDAARPLRDDITIVAVHNYGAGDILELSNGEMVSFAGASVDLGKREVTLKE